MLLLQLSLTEMTDNAGACLYYDVDTRRGARNFCGPALILYIDWTTPTGIALLHGWFKFDAVWLSGVCSLVTKCVLVAPW